jgi:hypothetical protein
MEEMLLEIAVSTTHFHTQVHFIHTVFPSIPQTFDCEFV